MTEELTMIETKSLNADLSRSPGYQATADSGTSPGYQATADSGTSLGYQATADAGTSSGRGYQATVNPTNTPPGPLQSAQPTLRDISSGVHPTLSYLETFSLVYLTLIVPLLTQPMAASVELDVFTRVYLHGISITVVYICGFLISGLFAEMHQYHGNNTGGIVWVARKYSGASLSYIVNAAVVTSAVLQVAYSITDISDLVERQCKYFYEPSIMGQWKYAGNFISIFILAALFLLSLLGLTLISRVSILFTFLSLSSVFTLSGYAIHNAANSTAVESAHNVTNDQDTNNYDSTLEPYFNHFFNLISQVVVVAFLVPLTEDNTLKKSTINVIGAGGILWSYISSMFLNISVANITSSKVRFVDQIAIKVGLPDEITITVSVVASICVLIRGYFILYAVCRIMLHLVVVKEEEGSGNLTPMCKLLKVPLLVYGFQCLIIIGLVFVRKKDLAKLALVSLFLHVLFGGVCHILHRYSTPEPSLSTPILGSFGSLKSAKTIKILIVVLIVSSVALASADLAKINISFASYLKGQVYATFTICIALAVIGTISLMASFQQQRYISMFYKVTLWTPIIPSAVILMCCVALVYRWFWGCVILAFVVLVTLIHYLVNRLDAVNENPGENILPSSSQGSDNS